MPFFSYMSQKYNIEVASKESTSAQKALPAMACGAASAVSNPLSLPRHPVHLRFEDFFLSFSIFFFIIIFISFLVSYFSGSQLFCNTDSSFNPRSQFYRANLQFFTLTTAIANCTPPPHPARRVAFFSHDPRMPRQPSSPHLSADLHHTYPLHFCNLSLRL